MTAVASLWSRLGDVARLVATPLAPSHYIALLRPLSASHIRQARIEAVRDEAPGVRTLTLRPGRGWRPHRAGQHVRVSVSVDGRIATRTFSISSPPERRDGCFTITVKANPEGRVSRALVHDIAPGTFVTVGLPEGELVMPEGAPVRPLFVTAGSGITPIASMVRSLVARDRIHDVVHVHFAPTPDDDIFRDELDVLAAVEPQYRRFVIYTATDRRRLTRERLAELVPDWRERETWACGPERLLAPLLATFERAGRASALHIERFHATRAAIPADAAGGAVTLATSGVRTTADGRTPLLRVIEDAGLAPAHGCRMGICHSCDTTLISGCVRDLRTGTRIDEPGARIQICVCAAAGDVELTL